jgi:LmbE family N-acetylglucosaminyl deacetylase
LGAHGVHFLGYVDPPIGADGRLFAYTEDLTELSQRLVRLLTDLNPILILTHGSDGEYGHPAHVVTHRGVLAAHERIRQRGLRPHLYTFSAAIPGCSDPAFNEADPADVVVDVTPWMRAKAAAAECHRTQHALFFRFHPDASDVLDLLRTQESLHRMYPPDGPDLPVLLQHRAIWFECG